LYTAAALLDGVGQSLRLRGAAHPPPPELVTAVVALWLRRGVVHPVRPIGVDIEIGWLPQRNARTSPSSSSLGYPIQYSVFSMTIS
jgi:hypothetical protein